MLEWFARHAGGCAVLDEDMATIATPMDFLGINVYHPDGVHAGGSTPLRLKPAPSPPPQSPLGWQIDPQNLRDILGRLASEYEAPPIWITENGISDGAMAPLEQRLEDDGRVAYLAAHLDALGSALADGVDVRRYFVWSLLDSFEWELGYGAPFGLIHIDGSGYAEAQRALVSRLHRPRRSDQHG